LKIIMAYVVEYVAHRGSSKTVEDQIVSNLKVVGLGYHTLIDVGLNSFSRYSCRTWSVISSMDITA
jgi:hypothetical protein